MNPYKTQPLKKTVKKRRTKTPYGKTILVNIVKYTR